MIDILIAMLGSYGTWLLMAITFLAAFGAPAPATLGLIVAGALSAEGHLDYSHALAAGLVGTVGGDHCAHFVGRRAGGWIVRTRVARGLSRAETFIGRWGIAGVFASRWLLQSVLTPAVNYATGIAWLPWRRFTPAVVLGEAVYVVGYSMLGRLFNAQIPLIQSIASTASLLLVLAVVGIACVVTLSIMLLRRRRKK